MACRCHYVLEIRAANCGRESWTRAIDSPSGTMRAEGPPYLLPRCGIRSGNGSDVGRAVAILLRSREEPEYGTTAADHPRAARAVGASRPAHDGRLDGHAADGTRPRAIPTTRRSAQV